MQICLYSYRGRFSCRYWRQWQWARLQNLCQHNLIFKTTNDSVTDDKCSFEINRLFSREHRSIVESMLLIWIRIEPNHLTISNDCETLFGFNFVAYANQTLLQVLFNSEHLRARSIMFKCTVNWLNNVELYWKQIYCWKYKLSKLKCLL